MIERLEENAEDMPEGDVKTKLEKKFKCLKKKMDKTRSRKVIVIHLFYP